jgi:hypothetical protein
MIAESSIAQSYQKTELGIKSVINSVGVEVQLKKQMSELTRQVMKFH